MTSVHEVAPCFTRISAPAALGFRMLSNAALTHRPSAFARMSAANSVPVPIGLVRIKTCPDFIPPFFMSFLRFLGDAVHGESQRQLGALATVSAREGAAHLRQNRSSAGHHLIKLFLHLILETVRDLGDGEHGVRLGAHRPTISERVNHRHLPEDVRIVHEGAKEVHGVHGDLSRGER